MIIDKIDSILSKIFKSERLSVLMTMFLVFYGGYASPELPEPVLNLFENPVFRIFILSLILYKGNSDPQLSILVAIVYIVILDSCNKKKISEGFKETFKQFRKVNLENFVVVTIDEEKDKVNVKKELTWESKVFDEIKSKFKDIEITCKNSLPTLHYYEPCNDKSDETCEFDIANPTQGEKPILGKHGKMILKEFKPNLGRPEGGYCNYVYEDRTFPIEKCMSVDSTGSSFCVNKVPDEDKESYTYCSKSDAMVECKYHKK